MLVLESTVSIYGVEFIKLIILITMTEGCVKYHSLNLILSDALLKLDTFFKFTKIYIYIIVKIHKIKIKNRKNHKIVNENKKFPKNKKNSKQSKKF